MNRVIECVPNFSEGRDPAKVDALVAVMSAVPGVYVLDREMDPDHNRSVITLAGEPEAVAEAALRGVGKALELIDLTTHTGAHPRMGATDVIPFVPWKVLPLKTASLLRARPGGKSGSATTSQFFSTKPQQPGPTAPISKLFAKGNSRVCAKRSGKILVACPISASLRCIHRPARSRWARANS